MKNNIFFLLLFTSVSLLAQQKKYSISWQGSTKLSGAGFSIELPAFNEEHFTYTEEGLLFVDQWESSVQIDEASAALTNIVYQNISGAELHDLDVSLIPSKLEFQLKNSLARNKRYLSFQLKPIIKDADGRYKKITSFQLVYKQGFTSNRRSQVKRYVSSKGLSNSALSTGKWYKFYIDTTGVFKLSKNFLQGLGVDVNSVNPKTVKLYGHGGQMIPYSNAEPYPYDVPENAIKFVGEEDGVFNDQDYILFYGRGPKGFDVKSRTHINCYNDKTYYYINVGTAGDGKRIQSFSQPSGPVDLMIDSYESYQFHEVDDYNLIALGRRWFGDKFDIQNNQTFEFDFPNLITSEPITLSVLVGAVNNTNCTFDVSVNGAAVSTISLRGVSSPNLASGGALYRNVAVNDSKISVGLNFDNQGNPSIDAYLDYISIEAMSALSFSGKQFQFKNSVVTSVAGIGQYNIANASNVSEVWDVTDLYNVSNVENTQGNATFSFTAQLGSLKTYVAMSPTDFFEPKLDSRTNVVNQDIKGTIFKNAQGVFQDIDYIIVSPNNMMNQAERLADINRNQYGLNVKVLGLNEIYAEFSTGNQDVGAIRNVVKYVYDNASAPDKRIKYLCLFGDGSFDYKDRVPNNTNIVPSWYSYNSFSLTNSFVSDDFYGMMDDNEGDMGSTEMLDIAVGRIIADSQQRAKDLVDKIAYYYEKESFGSWRNNFVVISDDVDASWEGVLQETTDSIGNVVAEKKPFINVVKIHSDSYLQETSAGGNRYPTVNTAISNAVDNGALVVNYFGHGGEDGLAQERILTKPDIENFKNYNKLNCFVTVTCEFTRFDNPYRETAGEFTFWNKQAGAIGLITTTRQIYVSFAINFNNILGQYLFSYSNNDTYDDNEYPSMAEALRLAKADPAVSNNSQRRLVFFIGDPAMKLSFPKPSIRLTKINDVPLAQSTDTIKALSKVKLAGEVIDGSGNVLNNYSGILSTTIYDKYIERSTLGNDGQYLNGKLVILDFKTLGEIIFRGQASVSNGQFEFDFVVPKDIGIPVGYGRVSFYSKNEDLTLDQAGASVNTVKIGGLNENAAEDNVGPVINLYMNDENFVSGGITNESPTLLVKLEDANGVNTSSGVGHDIVAILDGDEKNPIILNDYYQTEVDDYTRGIVSFPLRDLEPGLHTLTLKAWDVYNNSSVSEIQFMVFNENQELVINNVLNYPNPFVDYTEFWFNHNSSESLSVSIQIFTVSGKLVRTLNGSTSGGAVVNSSLSRDIVWDGRDDFGSKIGKGVYVYKLKVHSELLNKTVEKIEKLVIL
ncbi:type IX secretion system sortase PorU [Tamlana agarivorans]|uniref:Type IX secretion system sortase PorU n=1 Tax=Pseudotamlana agarivorans TaxID=481183 RepID=A0ACC5U5P1_9FLAO|nr:type IX secretion system sortase PorU [Tamlana agarivorans]MBU2949540.1 type IX secretion system sortase PorU [Tamlana agarivorans]